MASTRLAVAGRVQPAINRTAEMSQRAADLAMTLLLAPTAFMALVFGVWRLGADLGWTEGFFITEGLFSHWQVWIALAVGLAAFGKKMREQ